MQAGRAEEFESGDDLSSLFPDIRYFLHRPLIEDSSLCRLCELQDGTYSVMDLLTFHDILDLREKLKPVEEDNG
uniref:Uncharacterized protein n=1 Tax=Escherichia phage vB_EcoM_4HA13 TaxID=2601675 RepID=A0A7D0N9X9_9CAUD